MYRSFTLVAFLALAALGSPLQTHAAGKMSKGFKFPHQIKAPYIQYKPGVKLKPKLLDFKTLVGVKPFVMFYFLPSHKPSVTELKAYAMAQQILGAQMQFIGVTKVQSKKELLAAYKLLKKLKISIPVVLDQRGIMAYVMLTRRVPSYAAVNKKGFLKLASAGQLSELVAPKTTLLHVLMRLARGGDVPFIRAPGYSPNPYNFIDKAAPRFALSHALKSAQKFTLKSAFGKGKKPVLLVFWSITCPHCQKALPKLNAYLKRKGSALQTVSMIVAHKPDRLKQLKTFTTKHKLSLPVLNDKKGKAFTAYRVMTVPTLFLLSPEGKVSAVTIGAGAKIGKIVDRMLKIQKKKAQKAALLRRLRRPAGPQLPPTRSAPPRKAPAKRAPARRAPAKAAPRPRTAPKARAIVGPQPPPSRRKAPAKRKTKPAAKKPPKKAPAKRAPAKKAAKKAPTTQKSRPADKR